MISENEVLKNFIDKLLQIDRLGAEKIFKAVQQQGTALQTIDKLIVPALEELGKGWDAGTVALAQVYMSSKICEELAGCFLSFSSLEGAEQPRMAIALLEDYHALGKMIIHASLRAVGYELHDYGRLTALELAQKVCEDSVEIILI
ncbi:MAG: cobalamin-binding protein, partial [Candidatus Electrothrix sp. AR1]|nr:cobalamin-binding protein [Candidatus Electrothrix sp. AR1]